VAGAGDGGDAGTVAVADPGADEVGDNGTAPLSGGAVPPPVVVDGAIAPPPVVVVTASPDTVVVVLLDNSVVVDPDVGVAVVGGEVGGAVVAFPWACSDPVLLPLPFPQPSFNTAWP
jgi:hypothetical protein